MAQGTRRLYYAGASMSSPLRILAVDVGTGTQDILLFESGKTIENCFKMVMPSPTIIVAERIKRATERGRPLLLTGVTMGGGPCHWAARDHALASFAVAVTAEAGRTFDDDLAMVEQMGFEIIDDAEAARREENPDLLHIELQDFDAQAIVTALRAFDVDTSVDALAIAVFDHGAAPPGYSDRRFRFDYISQQMAEWGADPVERALAAFASPVASVHPDLTRLLAVRTTISGTDRASLPLLLMDTGPAALLGALGDPTVRATAQGNSIFVNVGNFHVLAFHIVEDHIRALFEHHTGLVDGPKLVRLLRSLADGTLTNREIFDDSGHGALNLAEPPPPDDPPTLCMVTGPRRSMLANLRTRWPIYMAVPHGDMMLSGCYGLLRAYAAHFPESANAILSRLVSTNL